MADKQGTVQEYSHNKLCSTMNNSMCISADGDVLVWGKTNQGLFNDLPNVSFKVYPAKLNIPTKHKYYKAVHVSNGLNHAATILQCQLGKMVDSTVEESDIVLKIINRQRDTINKRQINVMDHFNDVKIVAKTKFDDFLLDIGVQHNLEELENMYQFDEAMKHQCEKGYINVVYFYYMLTKKDRQVYRALIWGNTSHGRLGLPKNVIDLNKLKRKTGKHSDKEDDEEEDEEEDDKKIVQKDNPSSKGLNQSQNNHSGAAPGSPSNKSQSKLSLHDSSAMRQSEDGQHDAAQIYAQSAELTVGLCLVSYDKQFVKISCGHHHTLAITIEGDLFVWGMGSQGCLGNGSTNDMNKPTLLTIIDQFIVDIAAGAYHNVFSWGVNTRGQLGIANTEKQLQPQPVTYFTRKGEVPTMIQAGDQHSATITEKHELFTWGNGDYYRLGHGTCMDELEPKILDVLQDVYVRHVSLGTNHSLCITNEGFIYAWGSGMSGKLGFNTKVFKDQVLPQRVGLDSESFRNHAFYQVSAGTLHSMGLSNSGVLFSWGSNKNGLLGFPTQSTQICVSMPQKLINGKDLVTQNLFKLRFYQVVQKGQETNKIKFDTLYPLMMAHQVPTEQLKEKSQNDKPITDGLFRFAVAGEKNTILINHKGIVYINGSSQEGMLTQDPLKVLKQAQSKPNMESKDAMQFAEILKRSIFQPYRLTFFEKTQIKYVACSFSHAIAISGKGSAYCWGQNLNFQLGLGYASVNVQTPIRLAGALEQKVLMQACCGDRYSAVLTDQGELWTFGTSESGVLGHDDKNYYIVQQPRMINDIKPMIYISCGGQSMMSIESETKRLWVWGNNQYGQLGISLQRQIQSEEVQDANRQKKPEKVATKNDKPQANFDKLKNPLNYIIYKPRNNLVRGMQGELDISQVSNGTYHSAIISGQGTIYTCGLSRYAGLQSVEQAEEGEEKQLTDAEKENWKQEKLKEFVDQFSVITSLESKRFSMVACQEFHSLAVTDEGKIWGWGSTTFGKMGKKFNEIVSMNSSKGNDEIDETIQPINIPLDEKAIFVCCGTNHCIAIGQSLKAYGWGCIMGGRTGISFKRLFEQSKLNVKDTKNQTQEQIQALLEQSEFWNKKQSIAMEILLHEEEENQNKFEVDDNKSMRSKQQKEGSVTKTANASKSKSSLTGQSQKAKKEEPEVGVLDLEDDEVLDEASLHSSTTSSDEDEQNLSDTEAIEGLTSSNQNQDMLKSGMQRSTMINPMTKSIQSPATNLLLRKSIVGITQLKKMSPTSNPLGKSASTNILGKSVLLDNSDPNAKQNQSIMNHSRASKNKDGKEVKKVDPLQKALLQQKDDCEGDNLYKQDLEIDTKLRLYYQEIALGAFKLHSDLNIVNLHLSEIMEYRARNLAIIKKSKIVEDFSFIVPQFIIRNIQLYEAIFSYIHYHPCYMLRMIEANELNKSQITKIINVIYKNQLLPSFSQVVIMTLAMKTFQNEFDQQPNKIGFLTDLKVLKTSSKFYPLYTMYLRGNERENTYLTKFAKTIVQEYFFNNNKKHFDHYPEQIRGTKMMHFLNLHYDFNNVKQQELKLECLGKIIISMVKKIIKEKDEAQCNNEKLLSDQTLHFHSEIISYMKKTILNQELESFKETLEGAKQKQEIEQKLLHFEITLLQKLDNFMIALYYGALTEYVLDEQLKAQDYQVDVRMFLDAETNLRQIAQCIDRFLLREPFQQDTPCYQRFNQIILERYDIFHPMYQIKLKRLDNSQDEIKEESINLELKGTKKLKAAFKQQPVNLNLITENASYLYSSVIYQMETQNLKEIIANSYEYEERYLQIEIQDILLIQGFYCSKIEQLGSKVIQKLFVRGNQDPIYIILKQLQFKIHTMTNFSTELLKRKINLKLLPNPLMMEVEAAKDFRDVQIFRCDVCDILLHRPLIAVDQEQKLILLKEKGWKCSDGHYNKNLDSLVCEVGGCKQFIDKSTLNCTRLFNSFHLERNNLTDLLGQIVTNIDFYSKDVDFFDHFQLLQSYNRTKKNQKLNMAIDEFMKNLINLNINKEEKQELDDSTNYKSAKKDRFNQNFMSIYEKSMEDLKLRAKHRQLQFYYLDFIKQLEILQIDQFAKLKSTVDLMVQSQTMLKFKMKIYSNENQKLLALNDDEDEQQQQDTKILKRVLPFGYYTSLNLFQQGILIKISFQGKVILKLSKSLKFYFYAQADGGWIITIVYMQEAFLNNLVRFIPIIWPNELQIQTIHIKIGQYLELKRMAKYKTQITFKNESVEATFNIKELINEMNSMDEKVL